MSTSLTIKQRTESTELVAQLRNALPAHVRAERFQRCVLTALVKNPKLQSCNQASFFTSILQLAQFGLEPDGRVAHLIPYGDTCQLVIDYKGLAELAYRSGKISNLHADVVCENDVFEANMGRISEHRIDYRKHRGNVYAVYATCEFKDGTSKSEVMSVDEVKAIQKRSKAGNSGPWITDWNEMAKKTVFKRLSKWLPLSPEFRDAVNSDDDVIDIDEPPAGRRGGAATVQIPDAPVKSLRERYSDMLESGVKHDDVMARLKETHEELCMPTPDELSEDALRLILRGAA
jgi:recombination protein RecT